MITLKEIIRAWKDLPTRPRKGLDGKLRNYCTKNLFLICDKGKYELCHVRKFHDRLSGYLRTEVFLSKYDEAGYNCSGYYTIEKLRKLAGKNYELKEI